MCLSPPGPLRCRMCLAESESISRRTATSWWSSLKSSASPNSSHAQALAEWNSASRELRLINVCFRLQLPIATFCTLQWYPVTLLRVAESPAQSESPRPTISSKPFWTISRGSRRRQMCSVLLRYRVICFTARLLSVVGLRTYVDSCWMANCMSSVQGAMKTAVERPQELTVAVEFFNPYRFRRDSSLYCFSPQSLCVSWWSQDPKSWLCRLHGATPPHLSNTDWYSCVQNQSWSVRLVPRPPRHPCDAGGSNLLIVVHVSSHMSKDRISTGCSSCRWFSVCCEYSIFLESGTIIAWMAPEEVSAPTRKHAICRGPQFTLYPCSNWS